MFFFVLVNLPCWRIRKVFKGGRRGTGSGGAGGLGRGGGGGAEIRCHSRKTTLWSQVSGLRLARAEEEKVRSREGVVAPGLESCVYWLSVSLLLCSRHDA